jgi:hypothetical protein
VRLGRNYYLRVSSMKSSCLIGLTESILRPTVTSSRLSSISHSRKNMKNLQIEMRFSSHLKFTKKLKMPHS